MNANVKLLSIRVDNLLREEVNDWLKGILENPPQQKFIATLNPEIILKGYHDKNYQDILNSSDLNLCDGFGIKFAAALKGRRIKSRYTGVDLTDYLLKLAKKNRKKVLVIVCRDSLSSPEEIKRGIERKYEVDAEARYLERNFFEGEAVKNSEIIFVNFGAPEQEKFIFENRSKFTNAKILVGVGGAFDFLIGKMKRAPKWMRKAGLEWLFRLVQEPKRLRRIWNAVIVFPILTVVKSK